MSIHIRLSFAPKLTLNILTWNLSSGYSWQLAHSKREVRHHILPHPTYYLSLLLPNDANPQPKYSKTAILLFSIPDMRICICISPRVKYSVSGPIPASLNTLWKQIDPRHRSTTPRRTNAICYTDRNEVNIVFNLYDNDENQWPCSKSVWKSRTQWFPTLTSCERTRSPITQLCCRT